MKYELEQQIYKDSNMSIYSLTKLLEDLKEKDNKIKGVIKDIIKGYERYKKDSQKVLTDNKIELSKLGVMPKMGVSMGIKTHVKDDNSDSAMAKMLIEGISMGSLDIKKYLNENGKDVDIALAKDFYQFQNEVIDSLKKFL